MSSLQIMYAIAAGVAFLLWIVDEEDALAPLSFFLHAIVIGVLIGAGGGA